MAVPTLISVTPAVGPVGGQNVIEIIGTNFQVPSLPPVSGPAPFVPPTVEVFIDDNPALQTEVLSSTRLFVAVPAWHGVEIPDAAIPAVTITIRNIDVAGSLIASEEVITPDAYIYERPPIHATPTKPTAAPSAYALVAAALITACRRQIIENTSMTTHVDYGEDGVMEVQVSKIPAIVIQGPIIAKDLEYWHNETTEVELPDGSFTIRKPPFVARMTFTLVGICDNEQEMLNLEASVIEMFERNKYLGVDANPKVSDPTTRTNLVLQMTQPPQVTSAPGEDNIRTFTAACEIRGIEVQEIEAFIREYKIVNADLEVHDIDGTLPETIEV
jgi:hypothetical protein